MERWKNRTALVTGASIGIGAAICRSLVQHGMIVIGCARSKDKIDALSNDFAKQGLPGKLIGYKCDIGNDKEIDEMFDWINKYHSGVDVCINNAGFSVKDSLLEISAQDMRDMLNVNVVGLVLCTKNAVKSMIARGVNDGHIFNMNSMSGHRLTGILNFYAATKYAVTALTEGFRKELVEKTKIRITAISPGLVETEFLGRAFEDDAMAKSIFSRCEAVIKASDIADILLFSLASPPNMQIHDVLVRPTGEKI